jgi:hypothetical protein
MADLSSWRLVPRKRKNPHISGIPGQFLTLSPRLNHDRLPPEVALLLPNQDGVRSLIAGLDGAATETDEPLGLGLFLADPFFVAERNVESLKQAGVIWVTNLPTVAQHDDSFAQQLSEVRFDLARELERLSAFKAAGFRIAVTVTNAAGARAACEINPECLIVLPHVADFGAGFPSFRQRGASADAVSRAAQSTGWTGEIYGLGTALEAESESLWPDILDGLICRPERRPGPD